MLRTLLLALTLGLAAQPALAADTYEVDDGHTSVLFAVQHFNAAWVYGRFNDVKGTFTWDAAKPSDISFDVSIATTSVDTDSDKRDDHLRGPDFFSSKEFPTLTFKSKTVTKKDADTYTVTGDLTLHGVTKPITVDFDYTGEGKDPWGGYRLGLHATFTIKRSDYGITAMSDGLSDEVRITVALEGTKKKLGG